MMERRPIFIQPKPTHNRKKRSLFSAVLHYIGKKAETCRSKTSGKGYPIHMIYGDMTLGKLQKIWK